MLWFLAGAVAGAITALVVVVALAARAVVRIAAAFAPKPAAPTVRTDGQPAAARQWRRANGWTCTPGYDAIVFETSRKN